MSLVTSSLRLVLLATVILAFGTTSAADDDAASNDQAEPAQSDDERAEESLCSYVVEETTFGMFQEDFAGYFTRSSARNPDAAPGVLLKPLRWEKTVNAPPDKTDLVMQMFGSDTVPEGLTPYVTGLYVLGHPKPGTAASYDSDPDSFNTLAMALFQDGVLTQLEVPLCDQ